MAASARPSAWSTPRKPWRCTGPSCNRRPRARRWAELQVDRLDTIETPLSVFAERLSGNDTTILYRFEVSADGRRLLHGRAAVIMTPDALTPREAA
jgi:hypothetical protein